jgi:spermidine synthase
MAQDAANVDTSAVPAPTPELTDELIPNVPIYLAVGLVAGAIIELQIAIMRLFTIGSWAHFGSFVISLAMMGFGLVSAVMCVGRGWFDREWKGVATGALLAFPVLMIGCNLIAQQFPFNAIFLVSDPNQLYRLVFNFALYLLPFLAGALFLGIVFLKAHRNFGRVYFADLTGSGLCGLMFLLALYLYQPENLIVAPLILAFAGAVCWFIALSQTRALVAVVLVSVLALLAHVFVPPALGLKKLAVSDYKGVAYARKFPDAQRVLERSTPFGYLEVYSSSYLHFAPGLSDNAGFNLTKFPANAYLGLYIDGDGPIGIIRDLPADETAYYTYLPMIYPYLLKKDPDTFVTQFGGGLSTSVALKNSAHVTVAEGNPAILDIFENDKTLKDFTGDILHNPKVSVINYDGRLYLAYTNKRYDIIDLSLADSAGLSNPGGFAIVEKFAYTREAFRNYMNALKDGGILSVTLWNKEEPPKSVLKLYSTMVNAARDVAPDKVADSFFATSTYLSTATVLYKKGGFTPGEIAVLKKHTAAMSFDELYYPGFVFDDSRTNETLSGYHDQIFGSGEAGPGANPGGAPAGAKTVEANPDGSPSAGGAGDVDPTAGDAPVADAPAGAPPESEVVPATTMGRIAWNYLIHGGYDDIAKRYVFDTQPLTNSRPYFAAYVKTGDLSKTLDRLDLFQDEWGYLMVWATLGVAMTAAFILVMFPVVFEGGPAAAVLGGAGVVLLGLEWPVLPWLVCLPGTVLSLGLVGWGFARMGSSSGLRMTPGKWLTIVYFGCLGLGYIMVEVGLIANFILALSNATVSASVLITGMLVFSGLGAFVSERYLPVARTMMPRIFLGIGAILIGYGFVLDHVLDLIGTLPYVLRLLCCFVLIFPPAFLMGFPMATAMTSLGRLGKEHMFLWAWGINGCFSVIGAALVPIIATSFGLTAVLVIAGCAYLLAIPAFFAVLRPMRGVQPVGAG